MKRFVPLLLPFLALLPLTLSSQNRWTPLPPIEGSAPPDALVRDRSGTLYMIADGLYRSDDQGGTWAQEPVPSGLRSVTTLAIDSTGALLAGGVAMNSGSASLYRRDGGSAAAWAPLDAFPNARVGGIAVTAAGIYIVAGQLDDTAYRSSDHGATWVSLDVRGEGRHALHALPNGRTIFLSAMEGPVISDDGTTWKPMMLPESPSSLTTGGGIVALDAQRIVAVVDHFGQIEIYRSSDGGVTWERGGQPPGALKSFAIAATEEGDLLMQGANDAIHLSSDVATSWIPHGNGPAEVVVALRSMGGSEVVAAAAGGPYRSTDAGRTWRVSAEGVSIIDLKVDDVAPLSSGIVLLTKELGAQIYSPVSGSWRKISQVGLQLHSVERLDDDRLLAGANDSPIFEGMTYLSDEAHSHFEFVGKSLMSTYPFDKVALGGSTAFTIVRATYKGGVEVVRHGESKSMAIWPDSLGTTGAMTRLHHAEGGAVFTSVVGRLFRIDSLFAADTAQRRMTTVFDGGNTALTAIVAGAERKLLVAMRNRIHRSWDDGHTWTELPPLAENLVAVSALFARDSTIYLVARDDTTSSNNRFSLYRRDPVGSAWIVDEQLVDLAVPFTLHQDLSGGIYVVIPNRGVYGNAATSSVEERAAMPWSLDLSLETSDRYGRSIGPARLVAPRRCLWHR